MNHLEWTVISSSKDANKVVSPYKFLFFDYDLEQPDGSYETGLNFVREHHGKFDIESVVFVHSHNPRGAVAISEELEDHGFRHVYEVPFFQFRTSWETGFLILGGRKYSPLT